MTQLSANMEWLYTEAGPSTADRIRAAAADGFEAVEIWGWRAKDLDAISAALTETGVELLSLIVDPQLDLTDAENHSDYLDGVRESLAVAQRLHARFLVVVAGNAIDGVSRIEQRAALVDALVVASKIIEESGVTLILEPLNDRVDHPGTFLTSTREGLDIVAEVDSPAVKLLLDAYHALMMGERLTDVIAGDVALVGHVQIADMPGRHEPGSGEVNWSAVLQELGDLGYNGPIGLEYMPSGDSVESVRHIRSVI